MKKKTSVSHDEWMIEELRDASELAAEFYTNVLETCFRNHLKEIK